MDYVGFRYVSVHLKVTPLSDEIAIKLQINKSITNELQFNRYNETFLNKQACSFENVGMFDNS